MWGNSVIFCFFFPKTENGIQNGKMKQKITEFTRVILSKLKKEQLNLSLWGALNQSQAQIWYVV